MSQATNKCVLFQLPVSPGSYSDHSNHAMSLAGMGHYRGHDNLPISDNNVSTTNDALEAGEWEVPEHEADLDVSILSEICQAYVTNNLQNVLNKS